MLANAEKLVGTDPKAFWSGAGFLNVQGQSQSQRAMLGLLAEVLGEKFQLAAHHETSAAGIYVYLDDVSFTGNQIKNDLLRWAEQRDVRDATVHVIASV